MIARRVTVRRVLAIDDQPEIRDVIRLALEMTTDWIVETCGDTTAAVAMAHGSPPDLIVLDAHLNGAGAQESIHTLRQARITAPVVLLTGSTMSTSEWRDAGAQGHVTKPFDPMTLANDLSAQISDC